MTRILNLKFNVSKYPNIEDIDEACKVMKKQFAEKGEDVLIAATPVDTDADAASYPNGGYRVTFNKDTDNEKEYVVTHGITPVFDITDIPSTLPNPQDPSSEIINAEYPNGGYNVKITVGSEVKEYNLKHGHTPVMTIESITKYMKALCFCIICYY